MLSKKILLLGAIGATTASAGTMVGLYAHEVSQRDERIKDKYLKVIYDNLNHIRNISGMSAMDEDFDAFKEDIVKHVAEKDSTLKEEAIFHFEATLDDAQQVINDQILLGDENHDVLSKEVTRMNDEIKSALEQIKGGVVGEHDINYYKKVLDATVSDSQFEDLSDDVEGLDTRIDQLIIDIDQNASDISQNSTNITTANGKITAMANLIGKETDAGTADTVFGKLKKLEIAAASAGVHFTNIDTTLTDLKDNLAGNTQGIDNLKSDLEIVKNNTDLNILTISKLQTAIDLGQEHTQKHDLLINTLSNEVNTLKIGLTSINNTHTADIADLEAKIAELKTADDAMRADLIKILTNIQALIARVTKNEADIKDLQIKFANLDANTTSKLDDLKKYFDNTLATSSENGRVDRARLELLITANTTSITSIKADLTAIKNNHDALKARVDSIDAQLIAYGKGLDEVKKSINDALDAIDTLSEKVDDNSAAILGLDTRIQALENAAASGGGAELLYQSANSVTREGAIDMWNYPFFSPQPLENFRRLEMMGYSMLSGRYFALDFNLDTQPDTTKRIHDYAFGLRLHPNRTWLQYKVDYVTDKIVCSLGYAAGNTSWTWNWVPHRYQILQIYGYKK